MCFVAKSDVLLILGFARHYRICSCLSDEDGLCGGLLTEPAGVIHSVDRDSTGTYDLNLRCRWIIVAPEGLLILLRFRFFRIGGSNDNCLSDYLDVSSLKLITNRGSEST